MFTEKDIENEKLKQFALAVHNFAYGTEWDDEDIVSAMDFDTIIEKMKTDEKELKEEYWEKGWETGKSDTWDEIDDAVKPLKEKITKLEQFKSEVIDAMKYDDDLDDEDIIRGIRGMEEEIIGECELKEQIEELKKQNKVKEIHETMLEGKKLKEELKVVERALGDIKRLKEENDNWEADDKNLTKIICMINALDEDYSVNGVDDIYECVKNLKEEAATNQRRATMYEFMNEFMEKADCMGEYFDYIRAYYPDEREAAGDCWTSDEEEEEV